MKYFLIALALIMGSTIHNSHAIDVSVVDGRAQAKSVGNLEIKIDTLKNAQVINTNQITTNIGEINTNETTIGLVTNCGKTDQTYNPTSGLCVGSAVAAIDDLTDGKSDGSSVFLGTNAGLNDDSTNNSNVGVGINSLKANTSGLQNTAVGKDSLSKNTTGYNNTALGTQALADNVNGFDNTAMGRQSLWKNTVGRYNSAFGSFVLSSNGNGMYNTAIGNRSMEKNTSGQYNIAAGNYSLNKNTTGNYNVSLGNYALGNNTVAGGNTAIGNMSLRLNYGGSYNTAVGYQSTFSNTTGTGNTAIGHDSLYSNTKGSQNTAIGRKALYKAANIGTNPPSNNTATGAYSLFNSTAADDNAAHGAYSLHNNTTGSRNVASGYRALFKNTTGSNNIGVGWSSARDTTTGVQNIAIGSEALRTLSTGYGNIAIGHLAGYNIPGNSNTTIAMGYSAGAEGSDNIAIGAYAYVSGGNSRINLGNLIYAKKRSDGYRTVGIGTTMATLSENYRLHINGNALATGYVTTSDQKWKKNIKTLDNSLEKILNLRGVNYDLRVDEFKDKSFEKGKQIGLIAQEVEEVFPEIVTTAEDGKAVNYSALVAPLIEAVKTQQKQIEEQQNKISVLEEQVKKLLK